MVPTLTLLIWVKTRKAISNLPVNFTLFDEFDGHPEEFILSIGKQMFLA